MIKEHDMATTFKVGDRVRLTDGAGLISAERLGQIGIVDTVVDGGKAVFVRWNDDTRLYYFARRFTLADAPASPRYVVKDAALLADDEPYMDSWAPLGDGVRSIADRAVDEWNRIGSCPCSVKTRSEWTGPIVAIDTHDAWHRVNGPSTPTPAPVAPTRPSDAAVCAAWAGFQRKEMGNVTAIGATGGLNVDGQRVTLAECRLAWSRELRRLATASAERERLRVVVQCQDPEEV